MDDCIFQFKRHEAFRQQVQIVNTLADVYPHLVSEYHTREGKVGTLSSNSFRKKIIIPGEQDPSERACPVEQLRIRYSRASVFLCGNHVHSGRSQ